LENGDETNSSWTDIVEEDAAVIELVGGWTFTTLELDQQPRYRQIVLEETTLCNAEEAVQEAKEELCETTTRSKKVIIDALGKLERSRRFFGLFNPVKIDVVVFKRNMDYADRLDENPVIQMWKKPKRLCNSSVFFI
jgi:hypothetical protein